MLNTVGTWFTFTVMECIFRMFSVNNILGIALVNLFAAILIQ